MRVFLDTSFLIAAAGSKRGLPRLLFEKGCQLQWEFGTSLYCEEEVNRNIHKVAGTDYWLSTLRPALEIFPTELVLDLPLVFDASKDRPVLISALGSRAQYLLTLDREDFAYLLGTEVYGLKVRTPLTFVGEVRIHFSDLAI